VIDACRFTLALPDGAIAGLRFGTPGAAPMLFAHANGFCAGAYRQMLERCEGYDIFAIDLRGHGRSTLPADPARVTYALHAGDLGAAIAAVRAQFAIVGPITLAGHSLGAVAAAMAAAHRDDVAALRLIEPVATPEHFRFAAMTPVWPFVAARMPLVVGARRRRASFASRAAARAAYEGKSLFRHFAPGALDDYLIDGMRPDVGGVRLACAPEWEAANFAARGNEFWGAVRCARAPVAVLGAAGPSTTLFGDAAGRLRRLGAAVALASGAGHLAPMEQPDRVAAFLADGR
jgi:pimeloyl-ACP methyl ester carboxylesterase